MITLHVNARNRTNYVKWDTLNKRDVLTSQVDTLNFETRSYSGKDWKPQVDDEVELYRGDAPGSSSSSSSSSSMSGSSSSSSSSSSSNSSSSSSSMNSSSSSSSSYSSSSSTYEKIFGGVIVKVEEYSIARNIMGYRVKCKDYTHLMDRQLVIGTYENKTIEQIIDEINGEFLTGFTTYNVSCGKILDRMKFNYVEPSKAIQQLADMVKFDWYVDYDKDIHFFSDEAKDAPFDITDGSRVSNLVIRSDNSQLRNSVIIRGGEYIGNNRTENYVADGSQTEFSLAYKYEGKPTVTVNAASKSIGLDNINDFTNYDVLWNYQEKYIRFETAPSSGDAIQVSGDPLIPVLVQVKNQNSIDEYGEYQYKIIDKSIESKQVARERGNAELMAYAQELSEGNFYTEQDGLRSGQVININSIIRDIDEDYIINSVSMSMLTPTRPKYRVNLVTTKTMGVIDFLQQLLLKEDQKTRIAEDEVLEKVENVTEEVSISETVTRTTESEIDDTISFSEQVRKDPWGAGVEPIWVLAPYFPSSDSDEKRPGYLDISMEVYSWSSSSSSSSSSSLSSSSSSSSSSA